MTMLKETAPKAGPVTQNKALHAGAGHSGDPSIGTKIIQQKICRPRYSAKHQQTLKNTADSIGNTPEERAKVLENLLAGYHIEAAYGLDSLEPFVSFKFHLKSVHAIYNMDHPLMKTFTGMLDSIAESSGVDPKDALSVKANRDLRVFFDCFMASLGQSRRLLWPSLDSVITFNTLMLTWADLTMRYTYKPKDAD